MIMKYNKNYFGPKFYRGNICKLFKFHPSRKVRRDCADGPNAVFHELINVEFGSKQDTSLYFGLPF